LAYRKSYRYCDFIKFEFDLKVMAITFSRGATMTSFQTITLSLLCIGSANAALAQQVIPRAPAAALIAAALKDDKAYELTRDLTTENGPRLAGSPAEARARDWAVARLTREGFTNVRVEPFAITYWGRLRESAEILGPFGQRLDVHAAGGSKGTPAQGIEAPVVRFANMAALRAAPDGSLAGKVAFVDGAMEVTRDGRSYGISVEKRRECAPVAAAKGAVACLVRSAGTSQRHVHVGQGRRGEQSAIPALIMANADAAQLTRILEKGPANVRLNVQVETLDNAPSGNVLAEIRGTERPDEIVVLGCHLDSWDLGTGALDDAVGCGIVTAAALNTLAVAGPPKRTIRIVWYGAEEVGVLGGRVYASTHQHHIANHVFAGESDSGGGTIYRADTKFGVGALAISSAMVRAMRPIAVAKGDNTASGGPDIVALGALGVPVIDLQQDVSDYFALHHTPDDTIERVDINKVRQNVAAWSITAWYAGWTTLDFRATR
jgi:carboxypeptidase Q